MEKLIECIDGYLKELENRMLKIVEDQSTPLMEKNRKMEPIVEQKRVLVKTKEELKKIKEKKYEAKCTMGDIR